MKVVVTGKGGVGKTTVAGMLSRHLAARAHVVVAVDCDPSPSLGITLGMAPDAVEKMEAVLNGLVADGHTHHDPKPPAADLLDRFGVDTPSGVRLVATGRIERLADSCMCCGSHRTSREFYNDLPADNRIVVADLEAGLNDLLWVRPADGDAIVIVTDGSAKATEISRRARGFADAMGVRRVISVANRCTAADAARLEVLLGVPVVAVPDDDEVAQADHAGRAPLDVAPMSPAAIALAGLADRLEPAG